jgi:hypothetical protein
MKLLMIFVDADHAEDVHRLLEEHGVPGYSQLPNVLGKGKTGHKLGSRAFPGSSTLFVVILAEGECAGLCDRLKEMRDRKDPEEGLKAYILDTMEVL